MAHDIKPPVDPQLDAALDRFVVPKPTAGFTDRIMAAAEARAMQEGPATSLPPAIPARRDQRGGWARRSRAAFGIAAIGLMGATATAAGLFGDIGVRIPVLSAIVETVRAPLVPPIEKPKPTLVRTAKVPAATIHEKGDAKGSGGSSPDALASDVLAPIAAPELADVAPKFGSAEERRTYMTQRVADRLERRLTMIDERQRAKGKVPKTEKQHALVAQLRSASNDQERKAALKAMREFRVMQAAKRAARDAGRDVPGTDVSGDVGLGRNLAGGLRRLSPEERLLLTPAQRAERRARRMERRAARRAARDQVPEAEQQ